MSIVFVVANKNKNAGVEVVGSKFFTDSTISISHSFQNSVTEHPVEQGVSFSDHVQIKNNRFTVSGVFGDFSLNRYAGDNLTFGIGRVQEAYDFLKKLRDNKTTFTLVSKYDTYPNCVIESLELPIDAQSTSSLYFNIGVVQIRTAKTELVNLVKIENVVESKKDDASGQSNGGKKSNAPAGSSTLDDLLGAGVELKDVLKAGIVGTPLPQPNGG